MIRHDGSEPVRLEIDMGKTDKKLKGRGQGKYLG